MSQSLWLWSVALHQCYEASTLSLTQFQVAQLNKSCYNSLSNKLNTNIVQHIQITRIMHITHIKHAYTHAKLSDRNIGKDLRQSPFLRLPSQVLRALSPKKQSWMKTVPPCRENWKVFLLCHLYCFPDFVCVCVYFLPP